LPVLMRRPTTTESETHVVLFMSGFLGRGFNSRRLHHLLIGPGCARYQMLGEHNLQRLNQ
jgi:hypothetical protein